MREVKVDLNKRGAISCSWIVNLCIAKMLVHHKLIYRFRVISVNIGFFFFFLVEISKLILHRKAKDQI